MRLFSRKKSLKRSGKRLLVVSGCMMALFMLAPVSNNTNGLGSMTAYAAEVTQSARWVGGDNIWKVKSSDGIGYISNCWFQDDVTGHWYLLDAYGLMESGLITDNSTGKTYFLNTNHDGTFGRMITSNGTYTLNGKSVYLEFNQNHDGSYGAITSGLSEARASGVLEVKKDTIPTDGGSGGGATENQTEKSLDDIFDDVDLGTGTGGTSSGSGQLDIKGQ